MEAAVTRIIELAFEQGVWAALYIYLFFRMLSENQSRESRYQEIIHQLSSNIYDGIKDIQDKLEEMTEG